MKYSNHEIENFESYYSGFRFLPKKEQDKVREELLAKESIALYYQKYKESFQTYQALIKFLPEYGLQNNVLNSQKWKKTDPNYYRLFIERSNQLLKEKGRLGMICPKGFIGELGSTAIRKHLLTSYTTFEFREFKNRTEAELIFDAVDPNFRFVVFTYLKSQGDQTICYRYCSKLSEINRPYEPFEKNPLSFYLELNGELCILQWIRSEIVYRILRKLASFPKLGDKTARPILKSAQELHMTNDRKKFTSKTTTIPLWEGSLINHYSMEKHPHQYVKPSVFSPKEDFYTDRIVIRTILPNSVRKFYSTILPAGIAIGNSLVYFKPKQSKEEQYYIVGLLNSLLVEYRGKQLLSKMTLNQYIIDILPIPRDVNPTSKSIAHLSRMLIVGQVEPTKRQESMNKIDAQIFKLFGLESAEVRFILNTFNIPETDKNQVMEFFVSEQTINISKGKEE